MTSSEGDELAALRRGNRQLEHENQILRRAAAHFAKDALPNEQRLVGNLAAHGIRVAVARGAHAFIHTLLP